MATKPTSTGLDLDALIAEVDGHPKYAFLLAGKEWSAINPDDVDWQIAADLDEDDVRAVISAYLGEEQYAEFVAHKVPSSVLQKLVDAINAHYAAEPLGEGEGLPPS